MTGIRFQTREEVSPLYVFVAWHLSTGVFFNQFSSPVSPNLCNISRCRLGNSNSKSYTFKKKVIFTTTIFPFFFYCLFMTKRFVSNIATYLPLSSFYNGHVARTRTRSLNNYLIIFRRQICPKILILCPHA
jgi:hypothetical protein